MLCVRHDGRVVCAGPTAASRERVACMPLPRIRSVPLVRPLLLIAALFFASISAWAIVTDFGNVANVHRPVAVHADQDDLNGEPDLNARFTEAFELGDELFATAFNALDGGGANVGRGQRYTRVPRADLRGRGEWFNHVPTRVTGPNAGGCFECHEQPFEDGAGTAALNVHRDPFRTGLIGQFIERNTPHIFATGAIQRLAEEMTDGLTADQQRLVDEVCRIGGTRSVTLDTKGVNFGTLSATRVRSSPCQVTYNTDGVRGVDFQTSVDNPAIPIALIIRPFQWKGSVPFLRDFNRGAAHNELGMQAVEVVGDNVDGDGDGVRNELTIGDMTSLAVYMAAQPRPTTLIELNQLGLLEPALTSAQVNQINQGAQVFNAIGCATCHIPQLTLTTTGLQRAKPERRLPRRDELPCRPADSWRAESDKPSLVRPDEGSAGQHHPPKRREHPRATRVLHAERQLRQDDRRALRRPQAARDGPAARRAGQRDCRRRRDADSAQSTKPAHA